MDFLKALLSKPKEKARSSANASHSATSISGRKIIKKKDLAPPSHNNHIPNNSKQSNNDAENEHETEKLRNEVTILSKLVTHLVMMLKQKNLITVEDVDNLIMLLHEEEEEEEEAHTPEPTPEPTPKTADAAPIRTQEKKTPVNLRSSTSLRKRFKR